MNRLQKICAAAITAVLILAASFLFTGNEMKSIQYIDRKSGRIKQEIVPGEGWLKWLYYNPFGKLTLHAVVKRKFLSEWYGRKMDLPASKNRIPEFIESLNIDMSEVIRPATDFTSFNDFFIRQLKPEARPISSRPDAVVSPADGKAMVFPEIRRLDSFFAKGQKFSIENFLQDQTLSRKYQGGTLFIIRLAPVDYHRFHFPADGKISESKRIEGDYYSVSPYAVKKRMKIYWKNTREYSVLSTADFGDILMCEVGATMVGSIVQTFTPDTDVKKGREKGWFEFGGSTVILLFEKGKVQADRDIIENTGKGYETSIKMGEQLAAAL